MMARKSKSSIVVALLMGLSISAMNRYFYGIPVARLPFLPVKMFQGLTHYGLDGEDFTQCSMTFLFVMSNLSLGTYVKRMLALEGPRSVTSMNPPMPKFL